MAKLNVVIPAVEVTVDGVTYRKVDRKAQAGDIIRLTDEHLPSYVRDGAFYEVNGISGGGNPYITDEDGDTYSTAGDDFEVYAPVSEPAAETSTDTITFEGATWRKVDRDVREGDAIKFTDEDRSSYLIDAELYVVIDVDVDGTVYFTDDDGDDLDADGFDYEVYELVAEETAVEYREVKRKAKVGERIKITNRVYSECRYVDDAEFIVKDADSDGDVYVDTDSQEDVMVLRREYVVLEPVNAEPTKTAEPERLAIGDYARVVERGHHAFNFGDIVEIIGTDDSSVPYHAKALLNGNSGWASASRLVRATDEEVAAIKDPRSQFAAGDKVRLISGGTKWPLSGFEDGGVYTVGNPINSYHKGTRVEIKDGGLSGFPLPTDIAKLTAAEVAEIERKQAEEAAKRAEETKWNAIGRKVNEFKRGDIVEGKRRLGDGEIIRGEIENIDGVSDQSAGILSYADGKYRSVDVLKLIVPVEQRFDRAEEVDAA